MSANKKKPEKKTELDNAIEESKKNESPDIDAHEKKQRKPRATNSRMAIVFDAKSNSVETIGLKTPSDARVWIETNVLGGFKELNESGPNEMHDGRIALIMVARYVEKRVSTVVTL